MDPLSFSASLIAVVTLAGQVAKTCKSYIDGITNHPREIRLIYIEVTSLASILDGLKILREDDYEDANVITQLKGKDGPIHGCQQTIRELSDLVHLNPASATCGTSGTKRRRVRSKLPTLEQLAWPFRKDEAVALLKRIATHKQTINAALTLSLHSEVRSIKAKLDQVQKNSLCDWLVQINPSSNHNAATGLYEEGTGDWISRSQEWNLWVNKQSEKRSLWIHGIPGAGKTILASHCIEELIKTQCSGKGNAILVYYYCYHGHNRDESTSFLRWLISQLCRQTDTVSSLTYDIYRSGQDPDVNKLLAALQAQLGGLNTVYVAIDALDESQQPRDAFLSVLRTLATDPRFQMIRLLTTSREYADIERVMAPISFSVPTSHQEVEKDIRIFVRESIKRRDEFKRWPSNLKDEVIDALAQGARGMFRWAVCQLDILRRLNCATDEEVRQTLKTLPEDLDETYMRIFNLIRPEDLELVRFTIHWIIWMQDLANDLYIPTLVGPDEVLRHYRLNRYGSLEGSDQVSIPCNLDQLRDCCGCLISIMDGSNYADEHILICALSHYTIKEFLESGRFKPSDKLTCLDLKTVNDYIPNLFLQSVIDHHRRDDRIVVTLHDFHLLLRKIQRDNLSFGHHLVFQYVLLDIKQDFITTLNFDIIMPLLQEVKWVGDKPPNEIIILLRLLLTRTFDYADILLKADGGRLLNSRLNLTWDDEWMNGTCEDPTTMVFDGTVIEFIASLVFTSSSALLFLLENYHHEFAQPDVLNRMLRSFLQGTKELIAWSVGDSAVEFEINAETRSKVVQKLHELGAVSEDENTDSDWDL
ncbi:hypothetical protein B0T20DRAFT_145963 [Sordaria brevicollis]|uniref:NACHT domain-containing protein n=1 Tax=Sordaria brevicollis TaxID=83679 RepID=A0AAE0UDU8_SORBR|nr:hypothetical protein B0T20DRAFT_145963 [Sordaria brevicollis]